MLDSYLQEIYIYYILNANDLRLRMWKDEIKVEKKINISINYNIIDIYDRMWSI